MRFNRTVFVRVCFTAAVVFLYMFFIGREPGMIMTGLAAKPDSPKTEPLHLKIVLERIYLDGEVSEEVVHENILSPENFWAKYDQWQIKKADDSKIIFSRKIDDISPLLKANGYFGITNNGVLTIFNGKPEHSNIIQSFFQIDIKKLESKKQQELMDGIPIKTKVRYVKVLETFKPYSMDGS